MPHHNFLKYGNDVYGISMVDIQSKIKAVEFALRSFAKYEANEERRTLFLKEHFDAQSELEIYYLFSMKELKDALSKLQEKENLLLAQQRGRNFVLLCFPSSVILRHHLNSHPLHIPIFQYSFFLLFVSAGSSSAQISNQLMIF